MAPGRRIGRSRVRLLAWVRRQFPLLWLVFAAVLLVGLSGLPRVSFDNALLRFFQSSFPAYASYTDVAQDFERDTNDVILLIEAEDLADPEALSAVSSVLLEAQFIEGVRTAISPLSIEIAAEEGRTEPLVPFPIPDAGTMADRFDAVRAETPALRRMLSEDRSAMVATLPITDEEAQQADVLTALSDLVARADDGSVSFRMAGYPVLRAKIAQGLILDVVILNMIGATVGFIVASLALRSVALGALTLPGPLVSLLLCLGLFGHLGIAVTTVTVTLPVLVMILATIDSIHIIFERVRQGARSSRRATLRAVRRIAVACLFAALTTAIAFAAISLSHAGVIAELGRMGVLILLISSLTVLLTQTLVLSAAGRSAMFRERFARLTLRPPAGGLFRALPRLALAHPGAVTLTALAALLVTALFYSQAGPRYSMLDSLAAGDPLRATFEDIEAQVVPISTLEVAVDSDAPEVLEQVETTMEAATGSNLVQSIASIAGEGATDVREGLPEAIAGRFVSPDGARALVTVPFRYESGDQALTLAHDVDAALAENPALQGVDISPSTGMAVMSASVINGILADLNIGLLLAVAAVGLLIGLWLRSARIALVALLPNMLPVSLIGAGLALSGHGIELAEALALTVAFGVAVDDTLHVLNRIRLTGGFSDLGRDKLRAAMQEATPVLVTTSTVLILGFGGSAFAATREVADFGIIATAVFVLALVADLLVLPAAVAFVKPRFYAQGPKGPT